MEMEEKIKYEKPVVMTYGEHEIIKESAKLGNPAYIPGPA